MENELENQIPINKTETSDADALASEPILTRPDEFINWETVEPHFQNRSVDRQWTIGIIGGIVFVIAIIFQNFLLGLLAVVAAFSLITLARQEPQIITYSVTKKGIRAGERIYPYSNIKSFWIRITDNKRELSIESGRMIAPMIEFPIANDVSLANLRAILKKYLPEERHEESLIDSVADYLGF